MIVRQESLTADKTLSTLPINSPLISANLVLVFGSVKRFNDNNLLSTLKARYPTAQIVGCSTSGEINATGVFDDSLQITSIQWEKTLQRIASTQMTNMQSSFETAASLAKQLKMDNLKAVLVYADGLHVNGSELLDGLKSVLGEIPVMGGMAGDGFNFTKTMQMFNETIAEGLVIAVGLYGDKLVAATGVGRGWRPYGPPRKVTKSVKNVVYELDGKPALPLYRMYIGDHSAKGLPGSGLKFPFAIIEDGKRDIEKIRTLLAVDASNSSLTFAGNVDEGETVRFCQSTHDHLVQGAGDAAHLVANHINNSQNGLAICVSCVGRKGVMAAQVADEVQLVHQILGPQTAITGFYSYGEFAPRPNTCDSVLHNQTMTIGYLSES